MGKQENMVLSVEAIKEIFRDLFKGHEQTLLTIVVQMEYQNIKKTLGTTQKNFLKMDANKIKIETAHRVAAK